MRAVNLIPSDARRGGRTEFLSASQAPALTAIGALAIALLLVTIYVLTGNTVSDRTAKLSTLKAQVVQQQAQATQLQNYAQFAQLAQVRTQTVHSIASARFDWHRALSDLSRVVPATTSLLSLTGTVAPGASAGSGGATGTSVRGDLAVPAIEVSGCTKTQNDVARLMSRLRLINGVTRVTLGDSQKIAAAQAGATVAGSTPASSGGCAANTPKFDLVVFFQPLPAAGPTGVVSIAGQPVSTAAGGAK